MRPLLLSLIPGKEPQLAKLRQQRAALASELNDLVDELAPTVFEDFDANRVVAPSSRSTSSRQPDSAQGKFLQHPLNWLDETIFGNWSRDMAHPKDRHVRRNGGAESDGEGLFTDGQGSGYVSGYTSEEAPDYDEVRFSLSPSSSPLPY
jgi:glycerol-3-phosphate O-acyltransferase/dihydroxyacetone phosphate acyltransferase